jgi:hypothetical protein
LCFHAGQASARIVTKMVEVAGGDPALLTQLLANPGR